MEGALLAIAVLACPLGMGLMMWFMGRSSRGKERGKEAPTASELREEQRRITERIDRLERSPDSDERGVPSPS